MGAQSLLLAYGAAGGAGAGALVTNGVIGSGVAFTRASTGYYLDSDGVLKSAAVDVPRIEYDYLGNLLGLLIEQAKTNLFLRSQEFDNASWAKSDSSVTADAVNAPDGTATADKLKTTTASAEHSVTQNVSVTNGKYYTQTIYAKAAEETILFINFNTAHFGAPHFAYFDLSAGTASSATATVSIENMGGGWYRCRSSRQASATNASSTMRIGLTKTTSSTTSTGANTTDGLYIWGAQFEEDDNAAFPTSYVPTAGSTVARSRDIPIVTSLAGIGFSATEGTFVADVYWKTLPAIVANIASVNDTTSAELMSMYRSASNVIGVSRTDGGTNELAPTTANSVSAATLAKTAYAYKANDMAVCLNAGTVATDASASLPTVTRLEIGASLATGYLNGHIKNLSYYSTRKTDGELQTLTT